MSKKLLILLGTLLAISLSLFVFNQLYQDALPKLAEEINNSAIGAILTAIVTVFLLQGQTAREENRDKNLKVFEKKQEVYHEFLERLKDIVEDGRVTIAVGKEPVETVDELKELLFQLSYIQMHSSEANTQAVFQRVTNIIKKMNEFSTAGTDKSRLVAGFYADFAEELFEIVKVLKNDLYEVSSNPIPKSSVQALLQQCDLYVEGEELSLYDKHVYFWTELQRLLKAKGYEFKEMDVPHVVGQYQASSQYIGISIPVYTLAGGQKLDFSIELMRSAFYYGFDRPEPKMEIAGVIETIQESSGNKFATTPYWFGWKHGDRYQLKFFQDNEALNDFNHPQKRKLIMEAIANEMDTYIQNFVALAEQKGL
ncbi:hypothetical protein [Neisseria perflava]|uniref:hypothetical protein n=1 Tax=Neisseria perflava TaxID=33053 RepID=UPI0020A1F179|nr:hypothetical protein [Neisseria perflava]MCP1660129.1 hypothetical protein [Neisseria perflava]MCP1772737.1 hypothetical protein [Neisseria perflava]